MTFRAIQDAVISSLFSANDRTDVMRWINSRAQALWTGTRWVFTISDMVALNLTANNDEVAIPATLRTVEHVYDDQGSELAEITRDQLFLYYQQSFVSGNTGRPEYFAVMNRKILLGPKPDKAYAFTCTGQLVWGHDSSDQGGNFVAGDMTLDTDAPYWPANHHEILVIGARSSGAGPYRQDPTAQLAEAEYQRLFAAMLTELADSSGVGPYGQRDTV